MKLDRPWITAHTGCGGTPPNTVESALAGLAAGSDFVEVDVRTTLDGVIVLSHDDDVCSASGMRFLISESTYPEIAEIENPPQLLEPLLIEVFSRGGFVNLDFKDDRSVVPAAEIIKSLHAEDQLVITGCEISRAKMV
ncbi:MAG: hypothetical protein HN368_05885, partial [Spirochaetales bacterium]|nr:hypothetical protein [Spirochaetales bacterium]